MIGSFACDFQPWFFPFYSVGEDAIEVPLPAQSPNGRAYDATTTGSVVGYMWDYRTNSPHRAFIYADGIVSDLGTPAYATESAAYGINESGVVCGYWNGGSVEPGLHAFVWDGSITELPFRAGTSSVANDINSLGVVCGVLDGHAFLWSNGITTDLGVPSGYELSEASGLNDAGVAVGYARHLEPRVGYFRTAFVWSHGYATSLPLPQGYFSGWSTDINNDGNIVGYCDKQPFGSNVPQAVVWIDGQVRILDELAQGMDMSIAWAINDAGQIAGSGKELATGDSVAILLTPVPPLLGDLDCDRDVDSADWRSCSARGDGARRSATRTSMATASSTRPTSRRCSASGRAAALRQLSSGPDPRT